jgi:organic radical activating enzyme
MRINKVQFSLGSWSKDIKYHLNRGKGHLPRYMWNRVKWHYFPRWNVVPSFPDHVDIELSSACDMRCPMCYTTTQEFKDRVPKKLMDLALFKKIVDECVAHGVYSIRLSFRGEPFLNKHIVEMTRYAKERGIKEVSTLTNGLRLNPEMFEEMIDAGLDWLTISFDGMGETYNRIRKPAKFDEAVAKIREYDQIKKRRQAKKPVVKIQTVWPAIEEDPQAFYSLFNPIADQVFANPLVDYLDNDAEIVYQERFTCPVLWQRLVIGADGEVLLCINDEFGHQVVGDARTESLANIWRGPQMTAARRIHLEHQGVDQIDICRRCHLPREVEKTGTEVDGRLVQIENYVNRTQEVGK